MKLHRKRVFPALIVAILLLTGCAAQDEAHRLDLTLLAYEKTVRWGKLYDSSQYQKTPEMISEKDRKRLKQIRITGYDLITRQHTPGKYVQVIEIKYYDEERAVIQSVTDNQIWDYDKDKGRWLLTTSLPKFK